jgi:hypothetical protein
MNAAAKHRAASARRQQRRHPARAAMHWSGPRLFRAGESEPCVTLVSDSDDGGFRWRVRLADGTLSDESLPLGAARIRAEEIAAGKAAA